MKIRVLLVLSFLFVFVAVSLHTQPDIQIPFQVNNEFGDTTAHFFIGVDRRATWGIDSILGEFDIEFHSYPPGGLWGILLIDSSKFVAPGSGAWSNMDYQSVSTTEKKYLRRYCVTFTRSSHRGKELKFAFRSLTKEVDSIRIVDMFDGMFYNVRINSSLQANITSENQDQFFIYVWYNNGTPSTVDFDSIESNDARNLFVSDSGIEKLWVADVTGRIVFSTSSHSECPDRLFNELTSGVYIAKITYRGTGNSMRYFKFCKM